jgi:hypothetical protein
LQPTDWQLLDLDFEYLGDGPAVDRQLWISEMESAVAAARLADGTDMDFALIRQLPWTLKVASDFVADIIVPKAMA